MRHQDKPAIAIVGAGIGGLAAAAALRKFFFDPVVYEQAEAFARVGAGIQQSPNAVKVHRWLGIEDRLRQVAFAPAASLNRDSVAGKVTNDYPLGREIEARYGAPYLTLHRGDLHAGAGGDRASAEPPLGKKLVRDRASAARASQLTFADGSDAEADAVIGADGVHSIVRDHVAGPHSRVSPDGSPTAPRFRCRCLRGVEIGDVTHHLVGQGPPYRDLFCHRQRRRSPFQHQPAGEGRPDAKESWSRKRRPRRDARGLLRSFHSDVQRLLAAAPEVHKWAIYERDPLPEWSKGRVVLLGDACHPMTPYMASGAAMALEDAVVLARAIDQADSFEAAFRFYETARKPRANAVQAGSSKNTWMRNETNPDWLYGYDASRVPLRSSLAADASTYYES